MVAWQEFSVVFQGKKIHRNKEEYQTSLKKKDRKLWSMILLEILLSLSYTDKLVSDARHPLFCGLSKLNANVNFIFLIRWPALTSIFK